MLYAKDYAFAGAGPVPLGTLTSTTVTDVLSCRGSVGHVVAAKVTLATSGTSVTLRFEGSLDNISWFPLDTAGDVVVTESGTVQFRYAGEVPYVRGRVVAYEGTAPTVVFSDSISAIA